MKKALVFTCNIKFKSVIYGAGTDQELYNNSQYISLISLNPFFFFFAKTQSKLTTYLVVVYICTTFHDIFYFQNQENLLPGKPVQTKRPGFARQSGI